MMDSNKLPFDIRLSYNKNVDIHHQICWYEQGIITQGEFITEVRKIEEKYKNITEDAPLLGFCKNKNDE